MRRREKRASVAFVHNKRCVRISSGFTLIELAFVVAAVALLLATTLPVLANSRLRSDRLVCANNLRRIGVAFHVWSDSHQDKVPWQLPGPSAEGGTGGFGNPLMNNAWYHFAAISNELVTPTLLACPSDNAKVATQWDTNPSGGFLNAAYRNNSVSYLVGCHAEIRLPNSVLSADRNVLPDSSSQSCSLGFQTVAGIYTTGSLAGWDPSSIHSLFGNVLFTGGNVAELSSSGLRKAVADPNSDNGTEHFLLPR